jgi:hypothetical protein
LETRFERLLETLDISAIAEWDVLVFLSRHGTIIASAAHMVGLIGYSQSAIEAALHKLTLAGLCERSRRADGIGLYKFTPLDMPARQDCLEELMKMADQREGRSQLIQALGRPNQ